MFWRRNGLSITLAALAVLFLGGWRGPGADLETGDAMVDLAARLTDGFAVFQHLPIGDLIAAAAQDVGGAQQDGGALCP